MDSKQFVKEYKLLLRKNFNPERAKKEKAYLYSDQKHYGISSGERKRFGKKHRKWTESLNKDEALSLVERFWNQGSFEERMMGLHVLCVHKEKLNLSDMGLIEKLMRESGGWVYLDSLIIPVMHHILGIYPSAEKYLKTWIKDEDFWVRRSALLAQLLFFREGVVLRPVGSEAQRATAWRGGNKRLFFDLAKSQFDENWIDRAYGDSETRKRAKFFIRKAIGWCLREMSAKDPESVYRFIKENKNKMSGLTLREGSRKLQKSL